MSKTTKSNKLLEGAWQRAYLTAGFDFKKTTLLTTTTKDCKHFEGKEFSISPLMGPTHVLITPLTGEFSILLMSKHNDVTEDTMTITTDKDEVWHFSVKY